MGESSPWGAGRLGRRGRARLLFGASYEDASIEMEALDCAHRVLVIGASGDVALQLARPCRDVIAVDVNAAQVAYIRGRIRGAPRRRGTADRLLGWVRLAGRACGWSPGRVRRFLAMSDPQRQGRVFDEVLDTMRLRAAMDWGFAPATLLRAYRPEFVGFLPDRLGTVLRGRLRRGIGLHPNRSNPYARLLFTGQPPVVEERRSGPIDVHLAEAAAFLEKQPPGSLDGFALSNILDGPDPAYARRLGDAVARAGTPGAVVVLRTLREPDGPDAEATAARDRSLIWGGIIVTSAIDFPGTVRSLS